MDHLIIDVKSVIEDKLIGTKRLQDSLFSWWFNIALLILVVGSFGYFLYSSYDTTPPKENTSIKFESRTWNNAARNVPTIDYGQTPQIETADGIPGFSGGAGQSTF